jgi:hypothetical protein
MYDNPITYSISRNGGDNRFRTEQQARMAHLDWLIEQREKGVTQILLPPPCVDPQEKTSDTGDEV